MPWPWATVISHVQSFEFGYSSGNPGEYTVPFWDVSLYPQGADKRKKNDNIHQSSLLETGVSLPDAFNI